MTKKVKIAVIGTGRMGSVHVRNIVRLIPEADLVAVCDIRLEVAQAVADELRHPAGGQGLPRTAGRPGYRSHPDRHQHRHACLYHERRGRGRQTHLL